MTGERVVHLFPGGNEHHLVPIVQWLSRNCRRGVLSERTHVVLVCEDTSRLQELGLVERPPDVQVVALGRRRRDVRKVFGHLKDGDVLVLHSLFFALLPLIFVVHRAWLPRTAWIMWGGDVKALIRGLRRFPPSARSVAWRSLLPRLGAVGALAPGDYDVLVAGVGSQPIRWSFFVYGISVSNQEPCGRRRSGSLKTILVGNSGDSENRHTEILDILSSYSDFPVEIVCPLGYGGTEAYVQSVVQCGQRYFGNRFRPLMEVLPRDEFDELLSQVDILLYAHRRQQGLYTLTRALEHGAKAYLCTISPSFQMFVDAGVTIFPLDDARGWDLSRFLQPLSEDVMESNRIAVQGLAGAEAALSAWEALLRPILTKP